ncbi:MAG: hypothetical protein D6731_04795 [Planctomycetota bacterium]|nr:MAG: hypothetical protein D6731_04795 [Planctomycetota bacterium]
MLPLLLGVWAGCAGTPPRAAGSAPVRSAAGPTAGPTAAIGAGEGSAPRLVLGYRPARGWQDATEGPLATLVYVGRSDHRSPRPHPFIFSSDPGNAFFWRETDLKGRLTVQRLTRAEMGWLLGELEREGFSSLPWEPFGVKDPIGPERSLTLYRDGGCRQVVKRESLPYEARRCFTRIERRILALCRGS